MRKLLPILLLLAGVGLAPPAAAQSGYRVIVNSANPAGSLSKAEVSRLFLKKSTKWEHGTAAAPVDSKAGSVREQFSQAVHDKAASAVAAYWQQQVFSGRGIPPVEKPGDAEVIAFVKSNPGAIGYVSAGAAVDGVKVLEIGS